MANEAKTLRYIGPFKAVTVPALGERVEHGHQVDVEDAAIAAALLDQDDWEEVGKPKPKGTRRQPKPKDPPKDPPPAEDQDEQDENNGG